MGGAQMAASIRAREWNARGISWIFGAHRRLNARHKGFRATRRNLTFVSLDIQDVFLREGFRPISTLAKLCTLRDVERRVSVTRCAIRTAMETIVIFDDCGAAAERDSRQAIDVSVEGFELDISERGACVALEGDYVAFGPETVNVGYFFRSNGHLITKAGEHIACP